MPDITEARRLERIRQRLLKIHRDLGEVAAELDAGPVPTPKSPDLLTLWGPILKEHADHIQDRGSITLGESNEIRARHYEAAGRNRQNSAVMFQGPKRDGVLVRLVEHGTPRALDQKVRLTSRGERMLQEYLASRASSTLESAVDRLH